MDLTQKFYSRRGIEWEGEEGEQKSIKSSLSWNKAREKINKKKIEG